MDVLESPGTEAHRHNLTAGAVHRGVNDVEVFLTVDGLLVDEDIVNRHHVVVVHLAADDLDEVFVCLPFNIREGHFVHLVDDTLVMRLEHLRAVLPVRLVAVVLLGVVGSGDVHTTLTLEMTDSEGHLRRRTQGLKEVHLNAVSREDVGNRLGEHTSVITAVMTHHNSYAAVLYVLETALFLHLQQVVGVALGSHGYDVFVHSVGAGSHDTAQTAGTELESTIESIDELGLVLRLHHGFHLCAGLRVKRFLGPHLGNLHYFFQFFVHGS